MRKSKKRKSIQAPPTIDDNHQAIRGRKGNINKSDKQRAFTLKRMRFGVVHTKPETEIFARIRRRIKEGLKNVSHEQVSEPSLHNDEPCTQREASRASRIDENTRAVEIRSPAMPSNSSSARRILKGNLHAQIIQQALTRSKRRRTDDHDKPFPFNSDGGHKVEGQGEKTHEPNDQMHDNRIYRRDLHEQKVITRLICKQSR